MNDETYLMFKDGFIYKKPNGGTLHFRKADFALVSQEIAEAAIAAGAADLARQDGSLVNPPKEG